MEDYDREFAQAVGKRLAQMTPQEIEAYQQPMTQQEEKEMPSLEAQRLVVAERFFWRWVASESAECAIESIAELISYGGSLDEIIRKMALM